MPTKRYTPDQIIHHLREVEVLLSQGMTIENAARQIGVSVQTCYR
ncbi:MAG: helix-turn-helix domain-containing protein [Candidatus Marinimicrobia bacterium]|nr:helix-turn-helix domain-containing protein [Candidatus Neomarinimicrobiota bacterium]